jgi:hypothetical protein
MNDNALMTMDKPRRNAKGQFLVGSTGNRKGRPVGSRNKLAEGLLTDFAEEWRKHGKQSVNNCARQTIPLTARLQRH